MSDLVFATRGQAEMLAAQEAVRAKALATKQEFEEATKATGGWDAAMGKLKGQAESALRSVNTEQEKILDKIAKIQAAQAKGIIPPEAAKEAEAAISRLRQEWVDVDAATIKAKESTENAAKVTRELANEQTRLKSAAETALQSIQTEGEQIEEQIEAIELAMFKGLVPPDDAVEGIERLRKKLDDVNSGLKDGGVAGGRLGDVIFKAFDPVQIAKWAAGFVGVKAIIGQLKAEFEDLQDAIDTRVDQGLKPREKGQKLAEDAGKANKERDDAAERVREAEEKLAAAQAADAKTEQTASERRRDELKNLEQQLAEARQDAARGEESRQKELAAAIEDRNRAIRRDRDKKSERGGEGGSRDASKDTEVVPIALQRRIKDLEAGKPSVEIQRRIAALELEISRKALDPLDVGDGQTGAARSALGDAQRDLFKKTRAAADAMDASTTYSTSPEGMRAFALAERRRQIEEGLADVSASKSLAGLSTEELALVDKIKQQVGDGPTRRLIDNSLNRLNDGAITSDEFAADLRSAAQARRQPTTIQQQGSYGTHVPLTVAPTREAMEDSRNLDAIAKGIEETNRIMREAGMYGEDL